MGSDAWGVGVEIVVPYNDARRPDRFSQKEQNSSVRRQPVRCPLARNGARWPDRFSQKEQNSSVPRQPVRNPMAQNDARRPDRFSQKEQNSSVPRQPVRNPMARNSARRPDRFSQKEQNSSVRLYQRSEMAGRKVPTTISLVVVVRWSRGSRTTYFKGI
jgi:hypothetical protein